MEMKGFTGMFLFSSWWFWGIMLAVGTIWYVGEPLVFLYRAFCQDVERETDPLFEAVEKLEREERIE